MKFYIPTKIYEEKECVINHSRELAALGKKAMIVTGPNSSRKNGSLDDVTSALDKEGVEYLIFDKVEPNPSLETVMKARDIGVNEGVDFVIGVGGGSPIDAAKAIAVMILHKDKDADYLYATDGDNSALPVAAVPTTCGTGSEATAVSVLTVHESKTKKSAAKRVFPEISLVDAKYLLGTPKHIICDTAIDALAHLWESYINTTATDYSRMFAIYGMQIWSRSKDALLGDEIGYEDLRNLINASTFAGMAIAHTGTTLCHGLSYDITYEMNMPHGRAVGRSLSGYASFAPDMMREAVLKNSGFGSLEEYDEFYKKICGAEPIPETLFNRTVDDMFSKKDKLVLAPFEVTREKLVAMLGRI